MSFVKTDYMTCVFDDAVEWMNDYAADYNNFDYLWDDMLMTITGNDGSHPSSYSQDLIHKVVWETDFLDYCQEMGTNVGEIMNRGEEVVDCYARYWVAEYYLYQDLFKYWEDNFNIDEEDED